MRRVRSAASFAISVSLAFASGARAQSTQDLLPPQPVLSTAPLAGPAPAPGPARAVTPAANGFVLAAIAIDGNTAIPTATLQSIWAGLIGQRVDVAALDAVAAQVTSAYRAAGYTLSQAVLPVQEVVNGTVRLQVVEGFVDAVRVTGGSPGQRRYADRIAGRIAADRPLQIETLERGVLLLRDSFGGRAGELVETVLGPSAATFGAADLEVVVTPQPIRGYVTADNRGSRLYGDMTLGAGLRS